MAPSEAFQSNVACKLPDTAVRPVGVGGGTPLTNPTTKDSAVPTELLWAIKEPAPPFGAVTYLLLFIARRPMLPLPASTSVKVSQLPTEARFAINGLAPLLSAQTLLLLISAWKPMLPPPASMILNDSAVPTERLLATSALEPLFGAVTYWLLTSAFNE